VNETTHGFPRSDFELINWSGIPVGLGIFIVSLAGHAALPSIYSKMKDQSSFDKMLNWSFVVIFCIYCLIALFGYMTYADKTDILITTNLTEDWPANWLCPIVTGFVVGNCYCSVAPMFSVLAEIPEELFGIVGSPWTQRVFRTFLLGVVALAAYMCLEHLAIVEAVTGSVCTMMTSIILPGVFYAILYWDRITCCEKFNTLGLLSLGLALSAMLTVLDVQKIITGE